MLQVSDVSVSFGEQPLFADVSLRLLAGRRVALVGGNGAGKSTLLDVIVGNRAPDTGVVSRNRDLSIGWLPQDVVDDVTEFPTVLAYILAGSAELTELEAQLRAMEREIERASEVEQQQLLDRYGAKQERFNQLGGYSWEADAHRVLAGMGFAPEDALRSPHELSGGWRVRAALARLLLAKPDLLILDEPTNHLDIDTIRWLEEALRNLTGAVLFVSHDRDFIDAVADFIVELAAGSAIEYDVRTGTQVEEEGGFAAFVAQREARLAQLRAARSQQDRRIAEIDAFVTRFRYKASKARQVQSRIRSLDKVERIEVDERRAVQARFAFPEPPRSGRVVAELHDVELCYGERVVLREANVAVERGRKVALVGPNGSGKSTLLSLLAGQLAPSRGTVELGHNVISALVAQHQVEVMDLTGTVLDEFRTALDERHRGLNHRTMLGAFGFPGDLADRVVGDLSGGERTRLGLAKAMAAPVNLLLLDEPTNHLDLASRDILEDAITAYPGTVVMVTHDRHVIRATADAIIDCTNGQPHWFDGSYESFVARRDGKSTAAMNSAPSSPKRETRAAGRPNTADRRQATAALRREVSQLERKLGEAESEVAALHRQLADPDVYGDATKVAALAEQHGRAKDHAAALFTLWSERAEKLETLDRDSQNEHSV